MFYFSVYLSSCLFFSIFNEFLIAHEPFCIHVYVNCMEKRPLTRINTTKKRKKSANWKKQNRSERIVWEMKTKQLNSIESYTHQKEVQVHDLNWGIEWGYNFSKIYRSINLISQTNARSEMWTAIARGNKERKDIWWQWREQD